MPFTTETTKTLEKIEAVLSGKRKLSVLDAGWLATIAPRLKNDDAFCAALVVLVQKHHPDIAETVRRTLSLV